MNKIIDLTIFFFLLLSLTWAEPPIPAFQYDNQHTGRTETQGPATPHLLWSFQTEGSITASPVIAEDGTIYLASTDGNLYALNQEGQELWRYTAQESIFGTPAIAPDRSILFGDLAGNLYAIHPNGTEKWIYPFTYGKDHRIVTGPLVDSSGQIYIGSWNQQLHAITPEGQTHWRSTLSDLLSTTPVLDNQNRIYVAEMAGSRCTIHQYMSNSSNEQWSASIKTNTSQPRLLSTPTIDTTRNTLYVGLCYNSTGSLLAFNLASHTTKWALTFPKGILSSPALGPDGTLYFGCLGGAQGNGIDALEKQEFGLLYAIDPDTQTTRWTFQTNGYYIFSSPSVDGNGVIYCGDSDGILYAISPEGQELWRFTTQSNIASAPVIGTDGTLYITSYDSTLYAISNPTAVGDWRRFDHK